MSGETAAIDKRALYAISAGVYVFTMTEGGRGIGRVVDAVSQVASEPKRVSVSLMKAGHTWQAAKTGAHFALTVLAEGAPLEVVQAFGYQSSEAADKFAGFDVVTDAAGTPYVTDGAVSEMSCDVMDVLDMGSHILVIGEVTEAQVFSREEPMTYAGYRKLKSGAATTAGAATPTTATTPAPTAASEEASAAAPKYGWRCMICGYVVAQDELPDDFTCPVCGVGKDMFERVEL